MERKIQQKNTNIKRYHTISLQNQYPIQQRVKQKVKRQFSKQKQFRISHTRKIVCNFTKNSPIFLSQQTIKKKEKIYVGTFSQIYLGTMQGYQQSVVIKQVLINHQYQNRQQQIINKISKNQFIVKIFGTFITTDPNKNKYLNIVMEEYSSNLRQKIQKEKLSQSLIKLYFFQIIRGILNLHSIGICHRDIRPENILIEKDNVVVCDFGNSKFLKSNQKNLSYMFARFYRAPQLLVGFQLYDKSVDVWGLGCLLGFMLKKEDIFQGDDNFHQLISILEILGTPTCVKVSFISNIPHKLPYIKGRGLSKILPKCSQESIDLLQKMLCFQPKNRIKLQQILSHQFFDEIKSEQFWLSNKRLQILAEDLFKFSKKQISHIGLYYRQIAPLWIRNKFIQGIN